MTVAIIPASVFLALLAAVSVGDLGRGSIDGRAVTAAHDAVLAHPMLLSLARALTNLGAPVVVDALAVVVAAALWATGRRRPAVYLLLVRIVAQIVDSGVKVLVGRARPVLPHPIAHATGYSFPSGHATGAASLYLPLAFVACTVLTRRSSRVAAVGVAAVVCLVVAATRVLLGVHYPSDVLAGLALGLAVAVLLAPVLRRQLASDVTAPVTSPGPPKEQLQAE